MLMKGLQYNAVCVITCLFGVHMDAKFQAIYVLYQAMQLKISDPYISQTDMVKHVIIC